MNVKKIVYSVLYVANLFLLLFAGYTLFKSGRALDEYREREQEFVRTIGEYENQIRFARECTNGIREQIDEGNKSLQRQFGSIQELKRTIFEIEIKYEKMEILCDRLLHGIDSDNIDSEDD